MKMENMVTFFHDLALQVIPLGYYQRITMASRKCLTLYRKNDLGIIDEFVLHFFFLERSD